MTSDAPSMPQAGPGAASAAAAIATVTVSGRHRLNIVGRADLAALAEALERLAGRAGLRAVVLRGAGERAFIGGADLDEMAALDPLGARGFIAGIHRVCEAVRNLPVPVIARLAGYTLGAGLEIAAACDLRIAAEDAVFGMPEVKVGIPSVVEAALLPMLVGWGRTRQMLLLGEHFTAAEAASWGLVQRVVPPEALDAGVAAWVETLLAAAPRALAQQKALMRQWEDLPLRAAIAAGIDAFAEAFTTDEPGRLMRAFRAARRPPLPGHPFQARAPSETLASTEDPLAPTGEPKA